MKYLNNNYLKEKYFLGSLENEKWSRVNYPCEYEKDFHENYLVSTEGRIFSLLSYKFLKPRSAKGNEYKKVVLYSNQGKGRKERKNLMVHLIVARTFIPNNDPKNKYQIDHLNGVKWDNRAENLEWVTPSENMRRAQKCNIISKIKRICQLDIEGKRILRIHDNSVRAAEYLNKLTEYKNASNKNIKKCCKFLKGKETAYGFKWYYYDFIEKNMNYLLEDYRKANKEELLKLEEKSLELKKYSKMVVLYTKKSNKPVYMFFSITDALVFFKIKDQQNFKNLPKFKSLYWKKIKECNNVEKFISLNQKEKNKKIITLLRKIYLSKHDPYEINKYSLIILRSKKTNKIVYAISGMNNILKEFGTLSFKKFPKFKNYYWSLNKFNSIYKILKIMNEMNENKLEKIKRRDENE